MVLKVDPPQPGVHHLHVGAAAPPDKYVRSTIWPYGAVICACTLDGIILAMVGSFGTNGRDIRFQP